MRKKIVLRIDEASGLIYADKIDNTSDSQLEYKTLENITYEVITTNKVLNRIKRQPKDRYKAVRDIIKCISEDPKGDSLPKNNTTDITHLKNVRRYRLGDYRIVWRWGKLDDYVDLLDFDNKNQVEKRLLRGYK